MLQSESNRRERERERGGEGRSRGRERSEREGEVEGERERIHKMDSRASVFVRSKIFKFCKSELYLNDRLS
jgi:hypothetical protein